jgi:hypothetical protein
MREESTTQARQPKPKGQGTSRKAGHRRQEDGDGERAPKPDTSGGVKIKLRGSEEDGGLLSVEDLRQELQEVARDLGKYPEGTRFKWTTIYLTPVDQEGNKISLQGPKHQTITPYKSAADELKL